MTQPALWQISTIVAVRPASHRGFAHYDDYPITPWDVFTRYVGLGNRVDWVTEGYVLNLLLKTFVGDGFDVIPHSKEHAKNAEMIDRSFLKWLDSRQRSQPPVLCVLELQ